MTRDESLNNVKIEGGSGWNDSKQKGSGMKPLPPMDPDPNTNLFKPTPDFFWHMAAGGVGGLATIGLVTALGDPSAELQKTLSVIAGTSLLMIVPQILTYIWRAMK
jgi:hypothetical protein